MTPLESFSVPKGKGKVGYLFGYPISHSLSPILHQTVYTHLSLDYTYVLYESTDTTAFLRLTQQPNFYGAAVTMPHKVAIIPSLHSLTPEGAAIGAINTIFLRPDPSAPSAPCQLIGTNTDCIGIREALRQNMSSACLARCRGAPALVIGGGGTSRAAVYALRMWLGSGDIYMLNRDRAEVEAVIAECTASGFGGAMMIIQDVDQARALLSPVVIVSAIPDLEPQTEEERRVRECIEIVLENGALIETGEAEGMDKPLVLEMCYHPSPDTAISRIAARKGWRVVPGTEAMVWQGLEQNRYWTGREVSEMPVEKVKATIAEAVAKGRVHA